MSDAPANVKWTADPEVYVRCPDFARTVRRKRISATPENAVPVRRIVPGSGTVVGVVTNRMLSTAKAGAAAELKVSWTLLNGSVLWIPANPPVKIGSGTPLYE